jgi:hypothetical protein
MCEFRGAPVVSLVENGIKTECEGSLYLVYLLS